MGNGEWGIGNGKNLRAGGAKRRGDAMYLKTVRYKEAIAARQQNLTCQTRLVHT